MDITTQILGKLSFIIFLVELILLFLVSWLITDTKEENRRSFLRMTLIFVIVKIIFSLF